MTGGVDPQLDGSAALAAPTHASGTSAPATCAAAESRHTVAPALSVTLPRDRHSARNAVGVESQNLANLNLQGWERVLAGLVLAFAALVRLVRLGQPGTLVFDETYYVKDAFTLWRLGFEARWPPEIDAAFAAGDIYSYLHEAAFVVHPQVGKWLIAWGLAVGGAEHAWAWRLANAVVGVAAVWLVMLVARRLFRSRTMGLVAGVLMAVDGAAIVHSRIALLDQFLMFFVLAAFLALLVDRDRNASSLSDANLGICQPLRDSALPTLRAWPQNDDYRWLRVLAGVLLGLAFGVKWSAAYFIAGFGLLTVWWDWLAYRGWARQTGAPLSQAAARWLRSALAAFAQLVPAAALTYLASWFSWFITPGSFGRDWANFNPGAGVTWLPPLLRSWVHYQGQVWTFHNSLSDPHPYQAGALGWLLQIRPTSFFWAGPAELAALPGCARMQNCSAAVTSLGNPLLWWLATLAIVITIVLGIIHRDWRAVAALSGIAFGWLPWLLYPERTTFTFYAIVFLPWLIFTLCYALNYLRRWPWGHNAIAITVTAIVLVSIAFYPIWTAIPIERTYWERLMWLRSWV